MIIITLDSRQTPESQGYDATPAQFAAHLTADLTAHLGESVEVVWGKPNYLGSFWTSGEATDEQQDTIQMVIEMQHDYWTN